MINADKLIGKCGCKMEMLCIVGDFASEQWNHFYDLLIDNRN